jgi:hypothetical protein
MMYTYTLTTSVFEKSGLVNKKGAVKLYPIPLSQQLDLVFHRHMVPT